MKYLILSSLWNWVLDVKLNSEMKRLLLMRNCYIRKCYNNAYLLCSNFCKSGTLNFAHISGNKQSWISCCYLEVRPKFSVYHYNILLNANTFSLFRLDLLVENHLLLCNSWLSYPSSAKFVLGSPHLEKESRRSTSCQWSSLYCEFLFLFGWKNDEGTYFHMTWYSSSL